MSPEFTIENAPLGGVMGRGGPKSPLRLQIEQLQVGQVLRWRPAVHQSRSTANATCCAIAKLCGSKFAVRKTDQGYDIYRLS